MPAVSAPGFSRVFCSESLGAMNAFVWLICALNRQLNRQADRHPGKECEAWQHGNETELGHIGTISLGNVPVFVWKQWRRSLGQCSTTFISVLRSFLLSEPTATLLVQKRTSKAYSTVRTGTPRANLNFDSLLLLSQTVTVGELNCVRTGDHVPYTKARHDKPAGQQTEHMDMHIDIRCLM